MGLALFDTNVIIDYTKKNLAALAELTYYDDGAISVITWMEAGCTMTPQQLDYERSTATGVGRIIAKLFRSALMRRD
jgi:predicted nucleic acid-binding protein